MYWRRHRGNAQRPGRGPGRVGKGIPCRIDDSGFHPEAARDLTAVFQFEVSGDENFVSHLKIADGRCTYYDGPADRPSLVIKSPADIWLKISRGELNGQSAFMEGRYKVEGDMTLLLKMKSLFSA